MTPEFRQGVPSPENERECTDNGLLATTPAERRTLALFMVIALAAGMCAQFVTP